MANNYKIYSCTCNSFNFFPFSFSHRIVYSISLSFSCCCCCSAFGLRPYFVFYVPTFWFGFCQFFVGFAFLLIAMQTFVLLLIPHFENLGCLFCINMINTSQPFLSALSLDSCFGNSLLSASA